MRGEGRYGYPQEKRDEYFRLLGIGTNKKDAARMVGVTNATGHRWIRELREEREAAETEERDE